MRRAGIAAVTGNDFRDFYPVIDRGERFLGILRHRILQRASQEGPAGPYDEEDLASGLLLMADLYWNAFINLLIPDYQSRDRRGRND
jgi:hypothetical protein